MIRFTILGEPASKANSRKLVTFGRGADARPGFIKSEKAREYEASALLQIPHEAKLMLTGEVRVTLHIFYATERPDLDESIVLDVLQAKYSKVENGQPRELIRRGVYVNDRQVREKHVYHAIDRVNPRAEIEIEPMQPQQVAMFGAIPEAEPKRRQVKRVKRDGAPSVNDVPEGKPAF